jgi:2Fe-2S ferredoxin
MFHPATRRKELPCLGSFSSSPTVNAAKSVMQTALNNLVDGIVGECGGDLSCATCHVFVDPDWYDALPGVTAEEEDMLEATSEEPTKFSRLSCQIKCHDKLDGLVVRIPATQRL